MAKKFKSAVDTYKGKSADQKRRGATAGSFLGAITSIASGSKKTSKKGANSKKNSEPLTIADLKILGVIGIFILIAVTISFTVAITLAIITFIIKVIIEVKNEKGNSDDESSTLSQNEIDELQRHLANIDVYQDVANNSSDVSAVKHAMDELLKSIDFIMTYSEEELRIAGMTKEKLPAQRAFIVQHYDDVIKQAHERLMGRNEEKENNSSPEVNHVTENNVLSSDIDNNGEEVNVESVEYRIPTLEERLKTANPSKQGLYPHEILMLNYAHTYKVSKNEFQGFWYYDYSVTDPQSILASLCERGFLVIGSLKATIERLKVVELKEELQAVNAKTSGKKAELIERLMEVGDVRILEQKYTDRHYALTEKGKKELDENEYVVYLHRLKYMSIWDMNYLLHNDNPSHLGYRDIVWREFNMRCGEYFQAGKFGLYRNTRLDMCQFLMEENRHKKAFAMLCEVVAYDLSNLDNTGRLEHSPVIDKLLLEHTIECGFPYSDSLYRMPPATIEWMANIKDALKLSETEFREALLENFKQISLYRRIFTNEEYVEVVMNEIGNHPRKQAALYRQVEARLREELASIEV